MLKIAITGAPMSGKSFLLKDIKNELESTYRIPVFVLSEVASDLIEHCFAPELNSEAFQSILYKLQKTKEGILTEYLPNNGILLTDRGLADGGCYISAEGFQKIMDANSDDYASILSRYDHVIQLQTLCVFDNVKTVDTISNNNRLEKSKDDILTFEEKLKRIYGPHESYHFITATADIKEKKRVLLDLILKLYNSSC